MRINGDIQISTKREFAPIWHQMYSRLENHMTSNNPSSMCNPSHPYPQLNRIQKSKRRLLEEEA